MEPTIGPNHLRDGMKLSTECPRSYLELVVSDYSAFGVRVRHIQSRLELPSYGGSKLLFLASIGQDRRA
jgi:hypothetical protein